VFAIAKLKGKHVKFMYSPAAVNLIISFEIQEPLNLFLGRHFRKRKVRRPANETYFYAFGVKA
jgi:hypothetical protein